MTGGRKNWVWESENEFVLGECNWKCSKYPRYKNKQTLSWWIYSDLEDIIGVYRLTLIWLHELWWLWWWELSGEGQGDEWR